MAISLGQRDMVALYINYVLITFHKKGSIKVVIFKWNNCRLWELFLGSPTSTLVGGIGWLAPHRRQLRTCAMCILWEGEGVTWVTQVPRPTWQLPVENSLGRLQTKTLDGQGHDFSLLGFKLVTIVAGATCAYTQTSRWKRRVSWLLWLQVHQATRDRCMWPSWRAAHHWVSPSRHQARRTTPPACPHSPNPRQRHQVFF